MKQVLPAYRKTVLALGVVFSILLIFQNCSEPLELSDTDASTFADRLPFAYDVKMDTFAYMSCDNPLSDLNHQRALFTFRVGAYENGSGLKLTDEYLESTKGFTEEKRAEALFRSPTNSGAIMQLASRDQSVNYQTIVLNSQGSVQRGADIDNYLNGATLDSPGIAMKLANLPEGERINYFSGMPGLDGRFLEQSLRYLGRLKSVTDLMLGSTGAKVVIGYTQVNNPLSYEVRGPDKNDLARKIYGLEFRPVFGAPLRLGATQSNQTIDTTQDRNRVLQSLGVVKSEQKTVTAETMWSCPLEYKYMIVRAEDNDNGTPYNFTDDVCPISNYTYDNPPQGREKELEVLRRVVRIEDYYVNMQKRCIVPKDSAYACYTTDEAADVQINYVGTGGCNDEPENLKYRCPNFVSVCVAP